MLFAKTASAYVVIRNDSRSHLGTLIDDLLSYINLIFFLKLLKFFDVSASFMTRVIWAIIWSLKYKARVWCSLAMKISCA